MKRIINIVLLSLFLLGQVLAHSGKPDYHVIIDTDGALDDMRAISMLLADNDIRVLAITCSQGTLLPDSVYTKVKSLLSTYHHEGILLGSGKKLGVELPLWAAFAQNISWGNKVDKKDFDIDSNAEVVINKAIKNYKNKITCIALGSLKTYADWLKDNPELANKIERIVWYNSNNEATGFNNLVSPNSYKYIKQTGIKLDMVYNANDKLMLDESYFQNLRDCKSMYAKQICKVHEQPEIKEKIKQKHLKLWDDLVPLYLKAPILFDVKKEEHISYVSVIQSIPESTIHKIIASELESATETNNRVFINFPIDSSLYKTQFVNIINSTINSYGLIEWKAISMTNEIHGHTGIYSIIGAKMGVRAMEFFNVGVNSFRVTSFSGHKPPLSCFNDGIQISSGATIGQGLITISDSISKIPSAIFEFNNQKIHISLKPEIAAQMQNEIKFGVQTYGLLSDQYWEYIEQLAIKYWSDFDRHEIFDIYWCL